MITFTRLCSNSCCAEILYRRWSLTAFSAFDVFHDNIVEASVTTSLNNIVEQHRSLCSLVRCPSQHSKYFKFHTSAHACIILYVIIIILIIISHYYCACYHVNMFTMRINKYTFLTKHILTDFLIIFLTINPNQPCQLSLWEETGEPGENPRLSAVLTNSSHVRSHVQYWARTHDLSGGRTQPPQTRDAPELGFLLVLFRPELVKKLFGWNFLLPSMYSTK